MVNGGGAFPTQTDCRNGFFFLQDLIFSLRVIHAYGDIGIYHTTTTTTTTSIQLHKYMDRKTPVFPCSVSTFF